MTAERRVLDREEQALEQSLQQMYRMVDAAIAGAIDGLRLGDTAVLRALVQTDAEINEYQQQIEETCFEMLATQQPVASDLRNIIAASHIADELERMGDHAAAIAEISSTVDGRGDPALVARIEDIATRCRSMLRNAMRAYTSRDEPLAYAVGKADDTVDRLQIEFLEAAIPAMVGSEAAVRGGAQMLWIEHNLERIADRATNIAERAIFVITAKLVDLNRSE